MKRTVVMSAALGLAACTFEPVAQIERDAGEKLAHDGGTNPPRDGGPLDTGVVTDGGALRDAGRPDAGQDNAPPIVAFDPPRLALPWDTVDLDASGTRDPDGDPISYTWKLAAPPTARSGFGIFPGDDTMELAGPRVALYVSAPGDYVVRLTVRDPNHVTSVTATVSVAGFRQLPMESDSKVETLRYDRERGRLWVGTDSRGLMRAAAGDSLAAIVPCVGTSKINDVTILGDGSIAIATEVGLTLFDGTTCQNASPQVTKRRGVLLGANGSDIYACGDRSVRVYRPGLGGFDSTVFDFEFASNNGRYRGAMIDSTETMWFGIDENVPNDGVVFTSDLPNRNAERVDLFAGVRDDVITIRPGINREVWVVGDPGIAHIPDSNNPGVGTTFLPGAGLPIVFSGQFRDTDTDDGDTWIASQSGVVRYKRDVSMMVVMERGAYGLPADGEMSGIAVDEDPSRGRTVYAGGAAGIWVLHNP